MSLDEKEHEVDLEAVKRRRRRKLMWKRIRNVGILACLAVLVAAFLFSPWGPWKGVFFAEESGEGEEVQPADETPVDGSDGEDVAGMGDTGEGGTEDEGDAVETRNEKVSDTSPPTIAIVVDDTGSDVANLERWLAVDAPITFAVLPYCQASRSTAGRLYEAGFRIMLHIPTELDPPNSFSGKGQLEVGMDRQTVFNTLDGDVATVPHVTGINNHQGGRGCNNLQLMTYQCEWAKERGFYVVDSDSSTNSQVTVAAQSLGFPRRRNQVFIDHHNEPDTIREAMRRLARIAQQDGTAIGICHFHRPNTPTIVGEMVRTLRAEGINFAFVRNYSRIPYIPQIETGPNRIIAHSSGSR